MQKLQMETSQRYHLIPVKLAKIQKIAKVDVDVKGNMYTLLMGTLITAGTVEKNVESSQKTVLAVGFFRSHLRCITKRYEHVVSKKYLHYLVYSSTVDNSPKWEQPRSPS